MKCPPNWPRRGELVEKRHRSGARHRCLSASCRPHTPPPPVLCCRCYLFTHPCLRP
uniref:Uncharacterized protein n=1 Tax=Arundo donax TaxID=35708 RepID=A0A0A8YH75_ARUDO